ncbi:MAG TPA: GNAT family N-acetyltransferase, partial [Chthoniobacterales bacterium]|nr:GNAT family N-acetyltransferase [Chthoniobacterales bacterium]
TTDEAAARANYSGRDFYCIMLQEDNVVGYGMLRGWDEGYAIPSLGIALDPSVRGRGCSRALMNFLHDTAKKRGATKVRLKVDSRNRPAIELYRSLGYVFEPQTGEELVGLLDL